ncbi:transposase, partial [bacterium]|nr:transposase [bacterium]
MARKARIDIANYFYHVIARGQRKNPLFFSNEDREEFIAILKDLLKIFDILIYAFAIMGNHFHLLLYRGESSLSQFLKKLDTRYAIHFNKKYGTTGHVFQDRPKSFIILDNKYLGNSIKYIHLNPEKAGMVGNYNEYLYSSAKCYNDNINCEIVTKLKIFSGETGVLKYREFMKQEGSDSLIMYEDAIGTEELYKKLEKRERGRNNSYKG